MVFELIELIVLIAGFFVAWNIGANNTANCVGVAVGGRILSHRQAIAIVVAFVFLGAFLEGWKNMKTVGEGIILPGPTGVNPLSAFPIVAVASLIAAGLWMFFATSLGLPMSVSLSTVGAVVGAGLSLTVARPDLDVGFQYGKLGTIVVSWALNPLVAALFGFTILKVVGKALRRIKNVLLFNRVMSILILVAAAYSAYALGANDVGTSAGAVYGFFGASPQIIALFGAVALAAGALTFSRRVITTVGSGIIKIEPITAFAAQLGAAIAVWSFVQFGIPVSTSEAIIGGVVGVGLLKGTSTISRKNLGRIGLALALTPAVVCLISFVIGWILLGL